ncbi:MAG: ATP-binding protein [Brevefilum sp.]|nr:ATP-binding protein [Brevefilum sp.]
MSDIFAPLMPEYTIDLPKDPIALAAWVILFGIIVFFIIRLREKGTKIRRESLIWMAILSVLVLAFTPFIGILLEIDGGDIFNPGKTFHVMFFAAVPWLAAGGIIGFIPASLLAGVSGLLYAYLETHHIFTPLIFISFALIYTWGVRQNYRTAFFRYLRIPVFSALLALIITAPLIFMSQILINSGEYPLRIAIVLARMPAILISYGGMLFSGSLICVILRALLPNQWVSPATLMPSPSEKSLKRRFLLVTIPIMLGILILFVGAVWHVNVNSSRSEMVNKLVNASQVSADSWTTFIDTGFLALDEIGDAVQSPGGASTDLQQLLSKKIEEASFFDRLFILSPDGEIISAYPGSGDVAPVEIPDAVFADSDILAKVVARSGRPNAELSFFEFLPQSSDGIGRVLLGQTNIEQNPYAGGFLTAFASFERFEANGQILTRSGEILFELDPDSPYGDLPGESFKTPTYYETGSPDGQPLIKYYTPIEGTTWAVFTQIPASVLYQAAWQQSLPVLLIGIGILLVLLFAALITWTPVLKDIRLISDEMEKLTDGRFEILITEPKSKGEISQLFERFYLMTGTLGNRLKKHEDLLTLNEKMSVQNNLHDSLQAIMQSALSRGISSVRLLINDGLMEEKGKFSAGFQTDAYSHLDKEVAAIVRSQGELVLLDSQIGKRLTFNKSLSYPSAIIGLPMTWQGDDQGVFWVAYHKKKSFTAEDIDFFHSLSSKAAAIIAKGISFYNAVTLKTHLEAILDNLMDGILLLNGENEVVYHNHAARLMLGLEHITLLNAPVTSLISDRLLSDAILGSENRGNEAREFRLADNTVCQLEISPVDLARQQQGKVVILKDIRSAKKREMLGSEFVTTASHELRSPLTLIHGYAKLLRLTGNLNEQQDAYINNIINGVEELKTLVINLLDIGRLESGKTLEITRISAQGMAKNVVESMQPFARQKNIHLEHVLPDLPIELEGDEAFLAQALKNLLENAIKFTKMGGDVSLSVRKKEETVVFAVKDTGIGIAPLDQRYLFEKFKRPSVNLGQESKGSGLGLAIVKSIAERHGGKVWFESQLARGSIFYLEIPIKYDSGADL